MTPGRGRVAISGERLSQCELGELDIARGAARLGEDNRGRGPEVSEQNTTWVEHDQQPITSHSDALRSRCPQDPCLALRLNIFPAVLFSASSIWAVRLRGARERGSASASSAHGRASHGAKRRRRRGGISTRCLFHARRRACRPLPQPASPSALSPAEPTTRCLSQSPSRNPSASAPPCPRPLSPPPPSLSM